MKLSIPTFAISRAILAASFCFSVSLVQAEKPALIETLQASSKAAADSVDKVSAERRAVLDKAVEFVVKKARAGEQIDMNFICTHNSRRSHLSQVWAQTAAAYYGIPNVKTYSGGVEATACNIRTVRAMRRAGFSIAASNADKNTLYLIQYSESQPPIQAWSKVYTDGANPKSGYAAMMCCSDVDEKCPDVVGAALRVPLHYEDPKKADNTPEEAGSYDKTSKEIAQEMFYVMSQAATQIKK